MRLLIFGTIIGSLVLAAAVASGIYYLERPSVLRVAVPRDSDDQVILAAAALGFAEGRESIRLKLIAADSFAEASRALEEGHAELSIVRSDISMPPSGQTVLIMRRNAAVLFAPAQTSLHTIEDLRGHRIGILQTVPAGKADNQLLLNAALAQYDIPPASVKRVSVGVADLARAIERKEIEAVFAVGVPGSDGLTEAVNVVTAAGHGQPVFLPIEEAKAIAERSPAFEGLEVVRGAFGGSQPKPAVDFNTLGVSTRLVARNDLSNETAGEVTRLMLAARPAIAARIPIANRIEAPPADKGAALPVHPGALAFLDDEEQSFFDKYSDAFYIGAMCLSVLGTVLAAIAARFTRANTSDADKILHRLIAITKAARGAEHAGLLDDCETEADELLALALAPAAVHVLSVNRMGALNLAFNQVRQAIAERRQSLAVPVRTHFAPRIVRE
ncbi:MAG TPA: TAXI family TRAP transporter solute-binding subunit [Methylocella sp.]|nr:TAXI family TRAP transporter solute-binding subunit [Methylocella sp.]